MDRIEVRAFEGDALEFRAGSSDSGSIGTFSGYAMRYDQPSVPLPFKETFAPGSFTRSLKSRADIRLYVNHDETMVLASRRARTLRIEDRADGLWIEADLPDTTAGRDLRVLLERGDVHQQSVGFSAVRDQWSADGSERRVIEAKLFESSIVTGLAAYPQTTASVRNLRLLASRTALDVEALTDAMAALESGNVTADQAELLRTVLDRAAPAAPEPAPVVEPSVPVSVLMKQIDLLAKQIAV